MGFWKGLRMNTALKYALGALVTTVFSGQALACYTVYNSANQVVYQAQAAPVDMRYQLHQTLPAVFPGGHMVFSITDTSCPLVNATRAGNVNRAVNALMERDAYATTAGMPRSNAVTIQSPRP